LRASAWIASIIGAKNGFDNSNTDIPIMALCFWARPRASKSGEYPKSLAMANIFSRVSLATGWEPLKARETVIGDTPTFSATSLAVMVSSLLMSRFL
jgi:hypothetical protein